ncbi:MAG TPA: DUF6265 family protein [Verrucomicrobiae bacterium]|nr:DUF6265 family protein [Verrucomicrobiae bacterium]
MRWVSIALSLAVLVLFVPFFPRAQDKKTTLADLRWLSGCWDDGDTLGRYEEHWMKPAGTSVLGMSRTVADGETIAYEFLRIQEQKDGAIYYVANPSGQKPDSFKLVKSERNMWIFENPQHDFPQKVIYRLNGDSLIARIEGTADGKVRGIDFPMKRAKCE